MSWNVRGMNSKIKRSLILDFIKRYKPHIILLQETHLQGSKVMALKKANVMRVLHAEYSTYSRGVAILVTKKAAAHILQVKLDPNGRYAILVFRMYNVSLTLVCVYIPPPFSFPILDNIIKEAILIAQGPLLRLGDLTQCRMEL